RIRSWLGRGMTVDIQQTDYELRLDILKAKAGLHRSRQLAGGNKPAQIGPGVLEFIAEHVTKDVRLLEGALNQIVQHSELMYGSITVETARPMLKDFLRVERPTSIEDVLQLVSQHYEIKISEIKSERRTQPLVKARHVGMWLARELTRKSYPAIAL